MYTSLLLLSLITAAPKTADVQKAPAPTELRYGFAGIPALNFNSDAGFGFGTVLSLFAYDDVTEPYVARVTLQLFMTTKLIQDHNLRLDLVNLFGKPLRLQARTGYFQTIAHNFCGFGNAVTCDPEEAKLQADRLGLSGKDKNQFVRHYYKMRFIRIRAMARLRWLIKKGEHRVEVFGGYRGVYYLHGDYGDYAPYPGSKYAQSFPEGESGYASVLSAGVLFDGRDNEAAPTRGYFVEASVRAADPVLGSTWRFAGANLTARAYVSLLRNLVLTSRLVLDAQVGDMPQQEMIRINDDRDRTAFGGVWMGRGIREQRYAGRIKAIDQIELRYGFAEGDFLGQNFAWTLAGFTDMGWVAVDWDDIGGDPATLLTSFGPSLRVAWNKNFIVRADVGFSPIEKYSPQVYIDIGSPW